MNIVKKVKNVFDKLNYILSSVQKKYAVIVLLMGMIAALLELLGVAVIIPILDMLLDTSELSNKWFIKPFVAIFGLNSSQKIVWFICLAACLVYVVKNVYFTFYSWVSLKYAYKVKRELSIRILHAYMRQGYIFFVENNTSRLLQGISGDVDSVYSILNNIFGILTKIMTIVGIGFFIVLQFREMAFVLICLVIVCLVLIQVVFQKYMKKNGKLRRSLLYANYKTSIEAIQGNKEILVMRKQDFFINTYSKVLAKLNRVCVKVDLGTISPSYLIEVICVCGVLLTVAFQVGRVEDSTSLLSQLSTIAVGAFRILPALGAITSGINVITMNMSQLDAAYDTIVRVNELEKVKLNNENSAGNQKQKICFTKELEIKNLKYKYPNTDKLVIDDISLKVSKGECVAFIGASGAGKTTLSDIILALLHPTAGTVLMDGINIEKIGDEWGRVIGYVPQTIYIVDDTIKHNVAFGEKNEQIDEQKVWQALKIAQLEEFVIGLDKGINTFVGEQGIRFSGGQKQRLAIARALYRDPEILIFDEATAALDNDTEKEVMNAIEALQGYKTMIIVAHRLSTIKNCDKIYEIKNGKLIEREKEEIFKKTV